MSLTSLEHLDGRAVAEELLKMARRVRTAIASGDRISVGTLLDEVREAADTADGEVLRLLEVAEAFLRAALGSHWGRRERLLRLFVADFGEEARSHLDAALRGRLELRHVAQPDVRAVVEELIEVGALRQVGESRLDVAPSVRGVARDVISPVSFRLWDWVQRARAKAALTHPDDQELQASTLVADLGVSESDAQRHLTRFPLTSARPVAQASRDSGARLEKIYFRIDTWLHEHDAQAEEKASKDKLDSVLGASWSRQSPRPDMLSPQDVDTDAVAGVGSMTVVQ